TASPAPATASPSGIAAVPAPGAASRSSLLTNPLAEGAIASPESRPAAAPAPTLTARPAPALPAVKAPLGMNPLAGAAKVPTVTRSAPKADDDESLDLEDEDEEDDDVGIPAKAPAGGKSLPVVERPPFSRGTIDFSQESSAPKGASE